MSVNHGRVRACGREASQGKSPFGPTIPPARSRSAALVGVDLFCGCCCFLGLLLVVVVTALGASCSSASELLHVCLLFYTLVVFYHMTICSNAISLLYVFFLLFLYIGC